MASWYVKRGSQIAGPITLERLKELTAQGKVQESDLVRLGEDGPFTEAGQIEGLIPDSHVEGPVFQTKSHSESRRPAKKKSKATLFTVLAVIGLISLGIPLWQQTLDASRRTISKKHLNNIGLALHSYNETHWILPPGGTLTIDKKPSQSWQTFLLPYLDQAEMYNRIKFDYPWNHRINQSVFEAELPFYLNPAIKETVSADGFGLSHYVGNELVMGIDGNTRIKDIKDGLADTIFAVETGKDFKPWGDPTNIAEPVNIMGAGKKSSFSGGNYVLLGNGSVRFVSENIDPSVLKALSTPDGGDVVGEF